MEPNPPTTDAQRLTIFIVAALRSPSMRERVLIPLQAGFRVVVYDAYGLRPGQSWPDGIEVINISRNIWANKLLGPIVLWWHLKRIRPDLVHVHWAAQDFNNLVLARQHPLVVTAMGSDVMPDDGPTGIRLALVRHLLRAAALITTKSDYMSRIVADRFLDRNTERLQVIRWGVREDFFHAKPSDLRARLQIPSDAQVFLSIRAMEWRYRQEEILRGFIRYKQESGSSAHIVFTEFNQQPSYYAKVKALAEGSPCRQAIHFIPAVPSADMPGLFAAGDVVIHYPISDGMPQTLFESMAMGKFSILGRLPQYEGIAYHKENAFLVADENDWPEAFTFAEQQGATPLAWNIEFSEKHLRKTRIDQDLITCYRSLSTIQPEPKSHQL
jgi:glycosyltransferase involved in cell wall biosynthesis